jgi:hypothetical protein
VRRNAVHRRLSHASRAQGVTNGYPLRIEVQQLETREVEFNAGEPPPLPATAAGGPYEAAAC